MISSDGFVYPDPAVCVFDVTSSTILYILRTHFSYSAGCLSFRGKTENVYEHITKPEVIFNRSTNIVYRGNEEGDGVGEGVCYKGDNNIFSTDSDAPAACEG